MLIPCLHVSNGCGWTGPRDALAPSHIPSCPFEAIKGYFTLNNAKFDRIAEENVVLRHKVETLEGLVQTAKRELQSAKTALGPWYRPDGVYAYSRPSADLPPDIQPSSASTSRRYSQASDASVGSYDQYAPQDMLAAYFPSETEEGFAPGRNASFELASRRLTLPASPPWEAPFSPSTRPAAQHTVAPLNLSTTLEGALAGVRESVVALGGAVDSLGRRNDIALTNETLRLNEEVMSLRANVHGLRMQVRFRQPVTRRSFSVLSY